MHLDISESLKKIIFICKLKILQFLNVSMTSALIAQMPQSYWYKLVWRYFFFLQVDDENNYVGIEFTPTIPHCSMATLIGLSIRVKLLRSLPPRFKVHLEQHVHTVYIRIDQMPCINGISNFLTAMIGLNTCVHLLH